MADLHLGRKLEKYELLPWQMETLEKGVLPILKSEKPDVFVLTGDVFESVYPDDVTLKIYSNFLSVVRKMSDNIIVIGGNHDNPVLIEYLSDILRLAGVHTFGKSRAYLPKVTIVDASGPVDFYVLPSIESNYLANPADPVFCKGTQEIVKQLIERTPIDPTHRNVLLAHEFVYREEQKDGFKDETPRSDMVEASVFRPFDHVCMGHIHDSRAIDNRIVYSGAPYPMRYGEGNQKYLEIISMDRKGECQWKLEPILCNALQIHLYKASVEDFRSLPPDDSAFVYVGLDTDFIPEEIDRELREKYPLFCRCLGKDAKILQSDDNDFLQGDNTGDDPSFLIRQIGIEEIEREDGIFMKTLFRKNSQ